MKISKTQLEKGTTNDELADNGFVYEHIVEVEPTLDQLLKAPTYEGMTDEQIKKIVEYKENIAYENGKLDERSKKLDEMEQNLISAVESAKESANAQFEQAVALTPKFEEV